MKKTFLAFLIPYFIYTLGLYLIWAVVKDTIPARFFYADIAVIFIFLFTVTSLFHIGLLYKFSKNDKGFVSYYMLSTVLKFLIYLVVLMVYAVSHRENSTAFISNFLVIYFFLTTFEVAMGFRYFRKDSNRKVEKS